MSTHIGQSGATSPTMSAEGADPYLAPAFPLSNRMKRAIWGCVYAIFFRTSPRPLHVWRAFILRTFGARLGPNVHIYPKAAIWAPWNLRCEDGATIADEAVIYNPKLITLGSHAIVSQQAYLCGATHDYEDPSFPLIASAISIGSYAWICARATVQPGVSVGEGAVLALGAVASQNLQPWTIYGGVPAHKIKMRTKSTAPSKTEVVSEQFD